MLYGWRWTTNGARARLWEKNEDQGGKLAGNIYLVWRGAVLSALVTTYLLLN